jgi:hypothetical protein
VGSRRRSQDILPVPMTHPARPRRRLFRYSLRTLFVVVTLFCIWLGWNLHQVRQREAMLRYLNMPTFPSSRAVIQSGHSDKPWKKMPYSWSLLGAEPIESIEVYGNDTWTAADLREMERLFPEADVFVQPQTN